MKLRTALKIINETKYLIEGTYDSKYKGVYLRVNLLAPPEELTRNLTRERQLLKENPTVKYIDYNHAEECITITIV